MFETIKIILKSQNLLFHTNQGITVCAVEDQTKGLLLVSVLLEAIINRKTVLYLSGGRTPKSLYEQLANDEKIIPGAAGMIDERFGPKFHAQSNERMIRETGLLRYFEMLGIPFYPMLQASLIPSPS